MRLADALHEARIVRSKGSLGALWGVYRDCLDERGKERSRDISEDECTRETREEKYPLPPDPVSRGAISSKFNGNKNLRKSPNNEV